MRRILLLGFGVLLAAANGGAQQKAASASPAAQGTEGLGCFENLAAPEYPRSALEGHMDASVWSWTQVSPQGAIDKVETQAVSAWSDAGKLMGPAVEKAIRAAKIKPACYGKTVSVAFRYQLHGDPVASPNVTSRAEPPHILYIESQPAVPTQAAGQAPRR